MSTVTPNGAGGETTDFNHPDRLGTRTITNQQAGTSSEQATLPFGTALNAESTITTNKNRFTSYDRSTRTGLDYAVNRNYDSKQGRFTTVDPIGMSSVSLSAPQTLNLYSYCGNDPINHTDPSGLFWGFLKKLFTWVMVAIAVVIAVMTIIAAPATIAGVLGAISAGANAASQVLNAAGFKKIGMIFGLIAAATGFGSIIAGKIGPQHLLASDGKKRTFGFGVWFAALKGVGAVANHLTQTKRTRKSCPPKSAAIAFFSNVQQMDVYKQAVDLTQTTNKEQGGWVYQDSKGRLKAVLKTREVRDGADHVYLNNPPNIKGARVVGTFHVHRGRSGGIDSFPSGYEKINGNILESAADYAVNREQKVPGLLLSRTPEGGEQYVIYGPSRGFFGDGIPEGCK